MCHLNGHNHLWKDCPNNPLLTKYNGTQSSMICEQERDGTPVMNKDTPTESNGEQTDSKHRKLTRRRKCSGRREIHSIDSGNSNDEKLWHSLVLWFARKFSTKFATWKVLTILCHCFRRLVLFPLAVFCKYKAYILWMKWLDPIYRSMRMKLLDPSCGAWLLSPTNVCTTMTDAQQFFFTRYTNHRGGQPESVFEIGF